MFTQQKSGWTRLIVFLFLLLPFFVLGNEQLSKIIADGKSDYVIIVDKSALATPKFAASELQKYLEKATGVKLPIAERPVDDKKSIFVGENEFTRALGVLAEDIKPEGFVIRKVGDALILVGRDTKGNPLDMQIRGPQIGTLTAVYDFLERFVGVRWFMPGDLGEVVPKVSELSLGSVNLADAPAFVARNIYFSGGNFSKYEEKLWRRRNRVGKSLAVLHSHNWFKIIPCLPFPEDWPSWLEPRKTFLDHPEYYALVDGRRKLSHTSKHHGGQVCTSNPDVIRIFAETAINWFRKHPDLNMFSISWNDGGGFCECENCRALGMEFDSNGQPNLNDRLLAFYNAVGRLVYEKCPDKWLGAYVYYGGNLPKRTGVYRNICLWTVYNDAAMLFYNLEYRKRSYDQIRDWSELSDNMFLYSAFHGGGFWSFPYSSTPILIDLFPFLKAVNIRGINFYGVEGFGGNGMDLYLACRLAWDPSLDSNALIADYYEKFYGPETGARIKAYHELLQKAALNLSGNTNTKMTDTGELSCGRIGMIELMYVGMRAQARQMLDQALVGAPEGAVKERVRLVSDSFRLVEITLDALQAYRAVEKELTQENVIAFKKAVDAREQFLEEHKNSLAISYNKVRYNDERDRFPAKPAVVEYYLSLKGKRQIVECPRTTTPPTMDGKLDEDRWFQAGVIANFLQKDLGTASAFPTEARLMYDDKNIYIGVKCKDPNAGSMQAVISERDGNVWEENELEVFIDVKRNGKRIYQFLLNSIGTQCDLRIDNGKADMTWNGSWIAKTSIQPDGWTAEITIPLADLDSSPPMPGDIWGLNVCRVRRATAAPTEYSAFSPTFGLFLKPARFGDVIFK